jgi:hypothetical protein
VQSCIDRINARREHLWAEAVAEKRAKYERSWFRRIFGLAVPLDKDILEDLQQDSMIFIDIYRGYTLNIAAKLIVAADNADVVHVSVDDLEAII